MITLSNGHSFTFMTASGALAFDGRGWPWEWPFRWVGLIDPSLFTIVTKTLTLNPRPGNLRWSHPWSVVKKMRDTEPGWANAIGLTNPGIDYWIKEIAPRLHPKHDFIVSIEADDPNETVVMLDKLKGLPLKGVELNLSCPNTEGSSTRTTDITLETMLAASQKTTFPLIAKLSYAHDYLLVVKKLNELPTHRIDAISINSIPWKIAFPHLDSPLARYGGGGVSGKVIQSWTWKMAHEIALATTIPVIGPSTWHYKDMERLFELEAKAISFGSVFISKPWAPSHWVRR